MWTSFYYESAVVDDLDTSTWFECERYWRLRKAGLTPAEAEKLWIRVRPKIREELEAKAESLRELIEGQEEQMKNSYPRLDGFE